MTMKPNTYRLLDQCVQDGIELGVNRAYKHSDGMPSKDTLLNEVQAAVMQEICEWFQFDELE